MKKIIKDKSFILVGSLSLAIPAILWLLTRLSLPLIPCMIALTGLAAAQLVKLSVNLLAIKKNPGLLQQQVKEEQHFLWIKGLY